MLILNRGRAGFHQLLEYRDDEVVLRHQVVLGHKHRESPAQRRLILNQSQASDKLILNQSQANVDLILIQSQASVFEPITSQRRLSLNQSQASIEHSR